MERLTGGGCATRGGRCGRFSASVPSRGRATSDLNEPATPNRWVAGVAGFPIAYVVRARAAVRAGKSATTCHLPPAAVAT